MGAIAYKGNIYGGATTLGELTNVNVNEPSDGQILKYDEENEQWINGDINLEGVQTVTGNPITLTDGSETYADELVIDLEPIQSGSGTPSPSNIRAIQGYDIVSVDRCGKNLLDSDTLLNASGWTKGTDGVYSGANFAFYNAFKNGIYLFKDIDMTNKQITLSVDAYGTYNGKNIYISIRYVDDTSDIITVNTTSWAHYSLVSNANKKVYGIYGSYSQDGTSYIKNFQIEIGSTATTYEPYNGQTVSLQLGNKNLLPMTVEGIKAANTSGSWSGNVYTNNGITATLLTDKNGCITGIKVNGTASGQFWLFMSDYSAYSVGSYILNGCPSGGNDNTGYSFIIGSSTTRFGTDTGSGANVTVSSSANLHAAIKVESGTAVSNKVFYPMLHSASVSDPTFSPYNPTLGGMVYGGNLTLNDDGSAECLVSKGSVDLNTYTFTRYDSTKKIFYTPAIDTTSTNVLLSNYSYKDVAVTELENGEATMNASNHRVYIRDTRYDDATTFNNADKGQLVYELATPFTIHLSAEQLQLLQGTNNLWSNAGDVTLKYQPDNVIAEPKADVQRLRDDVDDRLVGNACRNLVNVTGQTITSQTYLLQNYEIKAGTYTVSFRAKNNASIIAYFNVTPANSDNVRVYIPANSSLADYTVTFTITADTTISMLCNGASSGYNFDVDRIQLERGSSPHTYEEYYPSNAELATTKQGLPVTILDDVAVSGSSTQYTIPDISQYTMVQCVLITCPASGVAYVRDTKTIPVSVLLHNITAYTYNHIITLLAIDPSSTDKWTECRIEMNSTTQISVRSDSGASGTESPRLSIIAW